MPSISSSNLLNDSPLNATIYNDLPFTDPKVDTTYKVERDQLLDLISDYGFAKLFSLHLVHKHYDCPDGHIMVYETLHFQGLDPIRICCPRSVDKALGARGKYFLARPGGTMVAYEYTMDTLPDLAGCEDFITTFSETVIRLGMESVFALTIGSPAKNDPRCEIEIPDLRSTLAVVGGLDWVPQTGIPDDWNHDERKDGIRTVTTAGVHASSFINHSSSGWEKPSPDSEPVPGFEDEMILTLDGQRLPSGTEAHNVLLKTRHCIALWT